MFEINPRKTPFGLLYDETIRFDELALITAMRIIELTLTLFSSEKLLHPTKFSFGASLKRSPGPFLDVAIPTFEPQFS